MVDFLGGGHRLRLATHFQAHALEGVGTVTARVEFPAGESSKNLSTVADLYNALVAAGLDRTSTVVALGGGVRLSGLASR